MTKCKPDCVCGRHSRVISNDHRQNIIAANKGRRGQSQSKCQEGCKCKRHKAYYRGGSEKGRKFSPEAKSRIAAGAKERAYTTEARQRLVEEMKGHHSDAEWETKRISALQEALTGISCPIGCSCGKHNSPPILPLHKGSDGQKGYVYIIEFSTGIIKVGRTTSPRQRIKSQLYVASKLGVEAINIWLSGWHENYKTNEVELLSRLGSPSRGEEYFRDSFSKAVKIAEKFIEGGVHTELPR